MSILFYANYLELWRSCLDKNPDQEFAERAVRVPSLQPIL